MVTVTAPDTGCGVRGGVAETVVILPVTPAGFVCPSPVRYRTITSPLLAGFAAELMELFWFRIAPCPVPPPAVKMPGVAATCGSTTPFEAMLLNRTRTVGFAMKGRLISYGTTALI